MHQEARGTVFRFEERLVAEVERHIPEVNEVWIRWVGRGSEARGRDIPDVHFVGALSADVMQRCAQVVYAAAKSDPDVTTHGQTSFHQEGARSPGDLKSKPALVWRRLIRVR